MKNLRHWFLSLGVFIAGTSLANAQQPAAGTPTANPQVSYPAGSNQNNPAGQTLRMGFVNTKRCLEESKLGKQEQANFEKMKTQMENILQEKERALEELESKLNDDDYMDSITDEAASELKRKKRTIRNEGMQLQNQYMQTLQQANFKIVQKLTEVISKASSQVAQDPNQPLDIIFTDEACTFFTPRLDVSDRIVVKMNAIFDAEQKDNPPKSR